MFTFGNLRTLFLLAAPLLLLQPDVSAQSGRRGPTNSSPPGMQPAPKPTPADNTHYDKVRVVVSRGLDDFVKALNEQGRLGYRLEKTVGYGDARSPQRYAAVLHLDPGHTYDYVSDPMPEDARYGDPLNYYAKRGYTLAHAYPTARCTQEDVYDASDAPDAPRRQETRTSNGSVLLFMRRDAADAQTKEYRAFRGLFVMDGGQKKELQSALDAAPPGFRPVQLLFSASGPHAFNATVLAERDLNEAAPPKVEYQLVKEVFGFEDEVNRLAAAGARYVGGARHGFAKFALMARAGGGPAAYSFKDDHQHEKEFPRMSAAGNSYVGLLAGDLDCDSVLDAPRQKLVFARDAGGAPARDYRVLEVLDRKSAGATGALPDAAVSGLQHLLAEGFRVRDLFYHGGLHAVLERRAASPAPPAQTSER